MLRQPVEIPHAPAMHGGEAKSEFGEERFKQAVARAKQYIFDGDIMQVVLSQRMSQVFPAAPLSLYRALRSLNPSPYMFYYDMDDHHVVGASPEILVRLENDNVTVRAPSRGRARAARRRSDMDLAIALRTAVIKGATLYVQAGAGIVADSVPASKWVETQNKARAVLRAAEMVLAGLDKPV